MCYLDPRAHRANIQDTMYLVNWAFLFKRQYFKHFLWPLTSGWQWFCLKHRKLKTSQVSKVLTGAGLIWQKQVRICWARKLNSFQPRIFSAQWGREGKIKVNFELRSIHTPTVHLVTKRNEAEWRRKDKNQSIHTIQYPTSSPWPPCLHTFLNWILSNHNGPLRPSWTRTGHYGTQWHYLDSL